TYVSSSASHATCDDCALSLHDALPILHSGVVIGADGFGFVKDSDGAYVKFPQIGTVTIEDDVEIGANTCVDRGALGETRIGEGTDRKSTRLNSSHVKISYAVFCLKKKK